MWKLWDEFHLTPMQTVQFIKMKLESYRHYGCSKENLSGHALLTFDLSEISLAVVKLGMLTSDHVNAQRLFTKSSFESCPWVFSLQVREL